MLVVCVQAISDSCIAVETTDSSLRLSWCQQLVVAYNDTVAFAVVDIFWHDNDNNNKRLQYMTDLPSVGLFISGLTPNTEYLLAFKVKFCKGEIAKPSFKRLATRQIKT